MLIDDGVVAEVGAGLRARDAEQIDATDTIVMPGFVDTHRHTWTSLFRNLGGGADGARSTAALAERVRPDDVYAATLVGLLGATEAGITTVVDWTLAGRDGLAEAALQAHADAGVRTVFVHAPDDAVDRAAVDHLREAAGPSTRVAFGSHVRAKTDVGPVADGWAVARELGLRIHAHLTRTTRARGGRRVGRPRSPRRRRHARASDGAGRRRRRRDRVVGRRRVVRAGERDGGAGSARRRSRS